MLVAASPPYVHLWLQRHCIIIGDAICLPSIVRVNELEQKPSSHEVMFHTEWQKNWLAVRINEIAANMHL